MRNYKATLGLLLMNIFIAFLGIGLVIPVLPTLMNELGLNGKIVGNLTAAFAVTQFLCSPMSGRAVDRFGRKLVLIIGLFLFGLSEFLFGLGTTIEVLFLSRILGGISAACIMPAATAFIADITNEANRSKAMGYMSAAINTGFIVGPGIGGLLADFGSRIPFFFAGGLGTLSGILSIIVLTEPQRAAGSQAAAERGPGETRRGWRRIFAPMYFIVFVLIFITSFGLAAFESFFSLFVDHKFQFTPRDIAIIITGGAAFGAVAQVLLFDRLVRLWGEIRLIRYCLILAAVLVFLMTIVHTYAWILLVTFIVFVGFDLFRPAATTYLANLAGDEQGFVGGMNSMFTSLANIFGPIVGGFLFDLDVNYPYYLASLTLVLGIVLTLFWRNPAGQPKRRPAKG